MSGELIKPEHDKWGTTMRVSAIIVSAIAAVIGALAWALISWKTGYEIGYVAWGIGIIVGLASASTGGRGTAMGVWCGALALAAIFCGKVLANEFSTDTQLREFAREQYNRQYYDTLVLDAQALDTLTDDQSFRQFIFDREYVDLSTVTQVEDVSQQDIAAFKEYSLPELREISNGSLSFEAWQQSSVDNFVSSVRGSISRIDSLKDSLSLFDLLWVFLGVSTAFKIGGPSEESEQDEESIHQPDELLTGGATNEENDQPS